MFNKKLFLALIIGSFFTHVHSMENITQETTDYQVNNAYNASHILNLAPEDVWLQIIARSDAKDTLRKTCVYFYNFASTRNEQLFLQNPLIIRAEVLERFALYYADFENNAILNNLLHHGANPNSADDKGNSLMHFAAQNGNLEMVKKLLEHPQFNANNMATDEYSPLLLAAHCKHMHVVEHILSCCTIKKNELLKLTKDLNLTIHEPDFSKLIINYNAMLCLAIHYELSDFAQLLLTQMPADTLRNAEKIDISQKNKEVRKMSALHYATIKRDTDLAQQLISNGMPVDARDNDHCTSFHYAIMCNATNMIKLLMNNNANINTICDCQNTSLHHTAKFGLMTKALFLLKHGAHINTKTASGTTALMSASMHGHTQVAKLLLAYNANINECNYGDTALSNAYCNYHHSIMRLLLNQPDIDIERAFSSKKFALLSCLIRDFRNDYNDMIDIIIEKTDINITDMYGNNPLSYAYWANNIDIMHKLISHPKVQINALLGQNLSYEIEENRRNHYGYQRSGPITILDLAMKHPGKEKIIDILKQYGAKTKAQLEEEGLLEKI